jgi:hypothetical protein
MGLVHVIHFGHSYRRLCCVSFIVNVPKFRELNETKGLSNSSVYQLSIPESLIQLSAVPT